MVWVWDGRKERLLSILAPKGEGGLAGLFFFFFWVEGCVLAGKEGLCIGGEGRVVCWRGREDWGEDCGK